MPSSDADPVASAREHARAALDRVRLRSARRRLVVAVSGGADSLCLLDVLVSVLADARRRLLVGHVDHRLRPESADDAEYVRSIASRYGLDAEVAVVDVPALAAQERVGLEEAARIGRYRALARLAAERGAAAIVTGHTRDDHVETVLLHLLRGSGRRGLAGLSVRDRLSRELLPRDRRPGAVAELDVIRPLLGVRRADTVAYCAARQIRWQVDPTNTDPRFLRNRVRHHLLPVLRTYNVAIDEAVDRLARTMHDEDVWIEQMVERRWRRLVQRVDGMPAVELGAWQRQPVAVRRRLARLVAAEAGRPDLSFDAVERVLAVGAAGGPARTELGGGLAVRRARGMLIFTTQEGKPVQEGSPIRADRPVQEGAPS